MDIATPNLTSSTCEIVPMRAVSWHSCLRKASWKSGVVTGIYRPPGIADTQYMHSIWFNLRVQRPVTLDEVIDKLEANPYVARTYKTIAKPIISFGRDHGDFGRFLNQ